MFNAATIAAIRDVLYGLTSDEDAAITIETYREAQTKKYVAGINLSTPTSTFSMTERAATVAEAAGELWHKVGMFIMEEPKTE